MYSKATHTADGREWNNDHPCYNGHNVVYDGGKPDFCRRCGQELEDVPSVFDRPLFD